MSRLYQYSRTLNPFEGVAESGVTSNTLFLGDAVMVVYSLTTSSATASRWTMQGHLADGFTAALPATADWQTVKTVTGPGLYSLDTLPRWARFQRTPSASSSTIHLTYYVGP